MLAVTAGGAADFPVMKNTFSQYFDGSLTENMGWITQQLNSAHFRPTYDQDGLSHTFEFYFRRSLVNQHGVSFLFGVFPIRYPCCQDFLIPQVTFDATEGRVLARYHYAEALDIFADDEAPVTSLRDTHPGISKSMQVTLANNDDTWKCVKVGVRWDTTDNFTQLILLVQEGINAGAVTTNTNAQHSLAKVKMPLGTENQLYIAGTGTYTQNYENFVGEIAAFQVTDRAKDLAALQTITSPAACNWSCGFLIADAGPCALPFSDTCTRTSFTPIKPAHQFRADANYGVVQNSPIQYDQFDYGWKRIGNMANKRLVIHGWFRVNSTNTNSDTLLHIQNKGIASNADPCTTVGATVIGVSLVVNAGGTNFELKLRNGKSDGSGCLEAITAIGYGGAPLNEWTILYIVFDGSGGTPELEVTIQPTDVNYPYDSKTIIDALITAYDGKGEITLGAGLNQTSKLKDGVFYFLQFMEYAVGDNLDKNAFRNTMSTSTSYASDEFLNCATWGIHNLNAERISCDVPAAAPLAYYEKNGRVYNCNPACLTCTGDDTILNCVSCAAGKPQMFDACLDQCPTKYGACGNIPPADSSLFDHEFSKLVDGLTVTKLVTGTVEVVIAQSGQKYPTNGILDALFLGSRGLWLNSAQITVENLVLAPKFSISMFVRPMSVGYLGKVTKDGDDRFKWSLAYNKNMDEIQMFAGVVTHEGYFFSTQANLNGMIDHFDEHGTNFNSKTVPWLEVGFNMNYSTGTKKLDLELYHNGTQIKLSSAPMVDIWTDVISNVHQLACVDFRGFVYRASMVNGYRTAAQMGTPVNTSCGSCGVCSVTSSGVSECVDSCPITQFYSAHDTACIDCQTSCNNAFKKNGDYHTEGCNRSGSCNLCSDTLCYRCKDFSTNSCYQCKANAATPAGQTNCACNSGYLQTSDYQCVQCVLPCTNCASDGTCSECDTAYFLQSPTDGCKACPSNCDKCKNSEVCEVCSSKFYLTPQKLCLSCSSTCNECEGKDGVCSACAPNYMLNKLTFICEPCPIECKTCQTDKCMTCNDGFNYTDGACVEDCGLRFVSIGGACRACPDNCRQCVYDGKTLSKICLQCDRNLIMRDNKCTCEKGYYYESLYKKCEPCKPSCETCEGSHDNCTSCRNTQIPQGNQCFDCGSFTGYTDDPHPWISLPLHSYEELIGAVDKFCVEECGDGMWLGQYGCDDGNNVSGDGCDDNCNVEPGYTCDDGTKCHDTAPPNPILTYAWQDSKAIYLTLHFDEPVIGEIQDNIEIDITGVKQFEWRIQFSAGDTLNKFVPWQIAIEPKETIAENTLAEVVFKDKSLISDERGNLMQRETADVKLERFTYGVAEETEAKSRQISVYALITAGGVAAASSVLGFSSFAAVWTLIEVLQLIHFFTFLTIEFPEILRGFCRAMSFANLAFLPNFFDLWIITHDSFENPPMQFKKEEYHTNFLLNTGSLWTAWMIAGLVFPLAYALNRLLPINKCTQKLFSIFTFAVWLRCASLSFLGFALACFLQFRDVETGASDAAGVSGLLFCFLAFLGLFTVVVGTLALITVQPTRPIQDWVFRLRFGSLYLGLQEQSRVRRSFTVFQHCRRFVFCLLLVYAHDEPMIQASLVAVTFLAYFIALVVFRPYTEKWTGNVLQLLTEGVVTLCTFIFLAFDHDDLSDGEREALGWFIIAFLAFTMAVNLVVILLTQLVALLKGLTSVYEKLTNVNDTETDAQKSQAVPELANPPVPARAKLYREPTLDIQSPKDEISLSIENPNNSVLDATINSISAPSDSSFLN